MVKITEWLAKKLLILKTTMCKAFLELDTILISECKYADAIPSTIFLNKQTKFNKMIMCREGGRDC